MKLVLLTLSLISLNAFAGTTTYTIEGMHCSGCKKMVEAKACKDKDGKLKSEFETCEASIIDEKNQIGELKFSPKKDVVIDQEALKKAITESDEYKITTVTTGSAVVETPAKKSSKKKETK